MRSVRILQVNGNKAIFPGYGVVYSLRIIVHFQRFFYGSNFKEMKILY